MNSALHNRAFHTSTLLDYLDVLKKHDPFRHACSPIYATGRCHELSKRFVEEARAAGIQADLLKLVGMPLTYEQLSPEWRREIREDLSAAVRLTHFLNRVQVAEGYVYVDWTFRQFDAAAAHVRWFTEEELADRVEGWREVWFWGDEVRYLLDPHTGSPLSEETQRGLMYEYRVSDSDTDDGKPSVWGDVRMWAFSEEEAREKVTGWLNANEVDPKGTLLPDFKLHLFAVDYKPVGEKR